MNTYLFAWNPGKWPWGDLNRELESVREQGSITSRWSCGNAKRVEIGSRFFLIRLGYPPKGIVASGRILSAPFQAKHWNKTLAQRGQQTMYVDIEFDALFKSPRVYWQELKKPPFSDYRWGIQMGGVRIPSKIAAELESLWARRIGSSEPILAEELRSDRVFREGAVRRIMVNAYERDPSAREACIQHHGLTCVTCGFNFQDFYGEAGKGFIHVHHLVPLAGAGANYEINPIDDMRPVCANCHAIIHRREPAYTLEEVKKLISRAGRQVRFSS